MTKFETAYLAAVARFEAEMKTCDFARIKLAERALSRATKKALR